MQHLHYNIIIILDLLSLNFICDAMINKKYHIFYEIM